MKIAFISKLRKALSLYLVVIWNIYCFLSAVWQYVFIFVQGTLFVFSHAVKCMIEKQDMVLFGSNHQLVGLFDSDWSVGAFFTRLRGFQTLLCPHFELIVKQGRYNICHYLKLIAQRCAVTYSYPPPPHATLDIASDCTKMAFMAKLRKALSLYFVVICDNCRLLSAIWLHTFSFFRETLFVSLSIMRFVIGKQGMALRAEIANLGDCLIRVGSYPFLWITGLRVRYISGF